MTIHADIPWQAIFFLILCVSLVGNIVSASLRSLLRDELEWRRKSGAEDREFILSLGYERRYGEWVLAGAEPK